MYILPIRIIETDDGPIIEQLGSPVTPIIGTITDETGCHVYEPGDEAAYAAALPAGVQND